MSHPDKNKDKDPIKRPPVRQTPQEKCLRIFLKVQYGITLSHKKH